MIEFEHTKIRYYENFIRDIVNSIVNRIDFEKLNNENKLFLTKIKERLCFDNDNGWKFLVSSLDTIGDSQFAITTFQNHKIENGQKFNTGENYLRLYGILSAVYIQQQALLKLSDLFKTGGTRLFFLNRLKVEFFNFNLTKKSNEKDALYRGPDYWDTQRTVTTRSEGFRSVPQAWHKRSYVLQLA
jgi:hypothetical protein